MKLRYLWRVVLILLVVVSVQARMPLIVAELEGTTTSEDLENSCSLGCAIGWDVAASSEDPAHPASYVSDYLVGTAWVANVGTQCKGEAIVFSFPATKFGKRDRLNFEGFRFLAAFTDDKEKMSLHARPKVIMLSHNGKRVCKISLQDTIELQHAAVHFDIQVNDTIRLEILECYPGKGAPVAIGEIIPQGAH